jgi:hypothetical protein
MQKFYCIWIWVKLLVIIELSIMLRSPVNLHRIYHLHIEKNEQFYRGVNEFPNSWGFAYAKILQGFERGHSTEWSNRKHRSDGLQDMSCCQISIPSANYQLSYTKLGSRHRRERSDYSPTLSLLSLVFLNVVLNDKVAPNPHLE